MVNMFSGQKKSVQYQKATSMSHGFGLLKEHQSWLSDVKSPSDVFIKDQTGESYSRVQNDH